MKTRIKIFPFEGEEDNVVDGMDECVCVSILVIVLDSNMKYICFRAHAHAILPNPLFHDQFFPLISQRRYLYTNLSV